MVTESDELAVRNAVVEAFLEKAEALTAPQIAERMGWSQGKIRRVLNETHGAGLSVREETRATYSRNYQDLVTGGHKVTVYQPSVYLLRDVILAERQLKAAEHGTEAAADAAEPQVSSER